MYPNLILWWEVEDVQDWLLFIDMEQLSFTFYYHAMDGMALLELTDIEMVQLQICKKYRKKLRWEIELIRKALKREVTKWSVEEVVKWLALHDGNDNAEIFRSHQIDGKKFASITKSVLQDYKVPYIACGKILFIQKLALGRNIKSKQNLTKHYMSIQNKFLERETKTTLGDEKWALKSAPTFSSIYCDSSILIPKRKSPTNANNIKLRTQPLHQTCSSQLLAQSTISHSLNTTNSLISPSSHDNNTQIHPKHNSQPLYRKPIGPFQQTSSVRKLHVVAPIFVKALDQDQFVVKYLKEDDTFDTFRCWLNVQFGEDYNAKCLFNGQVASFEKDYDVFTLYELALITEIKIFVYQMPQKIHFK
jgi:hypothetical protein